MTASEWVRVVGSVGLTIIALLIVPDPGLRQVGLMFLAVAAIAFVGYIIYLVVAQSAEIKEGMRQAFSEKDV
jgi:hypothetical protein